MIQLIFLSPWFFFLNLILFIFNRSTMIHFFEKMCSSLDIFFYFLNIIYFLFFNRSTATSLRVESSSIFSVKIHRISPPCISATRLYWLSWKVDEKFKFLFTVEFKVFPSLNRFDWIKMRITWTPSPPHQNSPINVAITI